MNKRLTKKSQITLSIQKCIEELRIKGKIYIEPHDVVYIIDGNEYMFELPSQFGSRLYEDIVAKSALEQMGVKFEKNYNKQLSEVHGNVTILKIS